MLKKMGLPIENLIVASNKNDILTRVFNSGSMKVKQTSSSLSQAWIFKYQVILKDCFFIS